MQMFAALGLRMRLEQAKVSKSLRDAPLDDRLVSLLDYSLPLPPKLPSLSLRLGRTAATMTAMTSPTDETVECDWDRHVYTTNHTRETPAWSSQKHGPRHPSRPLESRPTSPHVSGNDIIAVIAPEASEQTHYRPQG
jgi:hypothetical protein